jgi:hypothetical protein
MGEGLLVIMSWELSLVDFVLKLNGDCGNIISVEFLF